MPKIIPKFGISKQISIRMPNTIPKLIYPTKCSVDSDQNVQICPNLIYPATILIRVPKVVPN